MTPIDQPCTCEPMTWLYSVFVQSVFVFVGQTLLAVPSDPAAASRQELVAELNGVRCSGGGGSGGGGGGHAALEVYAAPRGRLSPGEAVVLAVRLAAKQQQQVRSRSRTSGTSYWLKGQTPLYSSQSYVSHPQSTPSLILNPVLTPQQQQQRQQPLQQQPQQMVAFLSLAGDGAADPAELLGGEVLTNRSTYQVKPFYLSS
jgi:hypothetical protein